MMHDKWRCLLVLTLVRLSSGETRCGGEWHGGTALDLEVTRSSNATFDLLAVSIAGTKEQCQQQCCRRAEGTCSVAIFHQSEGNSTCYLYKCSPLAFCALTYQNGSETFILVFPNAFENETRTNNSDIDNTLSPVHGDGGQSKPRKGVFPQEIDEGPLKHDNTTIKPRKGVLKEHNVNTVKARKGVEKESISSDVFSDDSSASNNSFTDAIGHSSITLSLETVPENASHAEQISSNLTSQPDQVSDEQNLTSITNSPVVLKTLPSSSDQSSTVLPSTTASAARKVVGSSQEVTVTGTTKLVGSPQEMTVTGTMKFVGSHQKMNETFTTLVGSPEEVNVPSTTMTVGLPQEVNVTSTTKLVGSPQEVNVTSTTKLVGSPEVTATTKLVGSPQVTTTTKLAGSPQVTATTKLAGSPQVTATTKLAGSPQVTATTKLVGSHQEVNASTTTNLAVSPQEVDATGITKLIGSDKDANASSTASPGESGEMSDWEFVQNSTSLHLVIGLVLGLMLLLTVMGVIAKRIHDSWQRRHYHRMDFLIDGMYHGEN